MTQFDWISLSALVISILGYLFTRSERISANRAEYLKRKYDLAERIIARVASMHDLLHEVYTAADRSKAKELEEAIAKAWKIRAQSSDLDISISVLMPSDVGGAYSKWVDACDPFVEAIRSSDKDRITSALNTYLRTEVELQFNLRYALGVPGILKHLGKTGLYSTSPTFDIQR